MAYLRCGIDGIPFTGPANPNIVLRLEHVNLEKCPEGLFPWFKGISGSLDGMSAERDASYETGQTNRLFSVRT